MSNNYINASLYGLGTRKVHTRVERICCNKCEQCSLYKEGLCFNKTVPFGAYCVKGSIERIDLGTSQKRDHEFNKQKVRDSEIYNKLEYPLNKYVFTVGDEIGLLLPFCKLTYENNNLTIENAFVFSDRITFVPKETLAPAVIERICTFKPTSWLGAEIDRYQGEIVPEFLRQLKCVLPDYYKLFIKVFPKYEDTVADINYVGRVAYLTTCNPTSVFVDTHGNRFHIEGNELVGEMEGGSFYPFGAKKCIAKIPLTGDLVVTITSNSQVLETTKFKK